ncbi:ShlB/FhaC/HecB family hemolysin secretion/activation protein [Sphingorhabdus sp. M41]|uniref:ShlB/FhaC/HecB family hemolysin secretion/activation protein n=1 Tax=Sphingorhabdus sp. M41 TaxID=1806885 RepID=UPI0018D34F17|nr:ShlB/FhaC/HecB family hemolysin secretion/activation protein [Sphingorhabdus sp. M41]
MPSGNDVVAPAVVPQQLDQQARENPSITIGAVSINSGSQIPAELLASSYEKFIGQEASEDLLRDLASDVSAAARNRGYIFASARIPSQSVKIGIVEVLLDPGAIDEVRIIGSANRRLRKILDELQRPAALSDIVERQLLLAGDLPGITLLNSNYQREDGKGVLVVTVREDKAKGHVALDNYGPETLGPIRMRLNLDLPGLLTDSDVLTTNVIGSAIQPKELTYIYARYAMTLGNGGTVVGISGAGGRTRSGGRLSNFDFTGHNRYASVFASHALKRSNDLNLWLNAELAYLEVQQSQNGLLFQNDQIATAALNFSGNYNVGIGRIYGGLGVTQGLGIFGASQSGDPLNSRNDGSGEFTKANFWINSILNIGNGFGMRLAGNAQIASRPLLSANEIAIGGPYFGKGYDFSERFGDEGVLGLAELRKEFNDVSAWLDWLQFYAFVDGGYVSNIGTNLGDGSLASAGGGIRSQIGRLDFSFEAAAPVGNDRFESGDQSPKINIQVGLRF